MYDKENILKKVKSLKKIVGTGKQEREISAPDNLVYLCYRGSIAHNMYIPSTSPDSVDDIDLLGVFLSPHNYYFGISQAKSVNPATIEIMQEVDGVLLDCVFYEIKHFVGMALKSNPNIFISLWVDPEHQIHMSRLFKRLYDVRDHFLGRHNIYRAFTGYANDQMKDMTKFNKKGYMGEKRKKLIAKFGYDTKNAAHLIRLLNMGIETLDKGTINVARTHDRGVLLDIKTGKWPLQDVKARANDLFVIAEDAYKRSTVREEPLRDEVEEILETILADYLCHGEV